MTMAMNIEIMIRTVFRRWRLSDFKVASFKDLKVNEVGLAAESLLIYDAKRKA